MLILAAIAVGLALFAACWWKYGFYAYNGIDLAYFNQVFWNTVHGRFFAQSIHPGLSIGEHAEFAILLLTPFYALFNDPRMLLALQVIALVVPVFIIGKLARQRLAGHGREAALAPMILAAAWLLNPAMQNMALFEFHLLPFAIAPLLMAMLAYEQGHKRRFLLWAALALLVREDVALVVVMIGLLAWLERKTLWWRIAPALLGVGWFVGAMGVIRHFSSGGGYKYGVYYAWLGSSPLQMAVNAVIHPLRLLAHVLTIANFEMALGFLMPLLLLPLLRPKRLVLLIGPLLQIILGAPGGGELITETHYAALFMPALFLAAIDGFGALPAMSRSIRGFLDRNEVRRLAFGAFILAGVYGTLMQGPLPSVAYRAATDRVGYVKAAIARDIVSQIPRDASVAAGYALLPALSSREKLTSLHYVFLGVTQFGEEKFVPPAIDYTILDTDDLLAYRTQFMSTAWAAPHYFGGMDRLTRIANGWTIYETPFVVYPKNTFRPIDLLPDEIAELRASFPPFPNLLRAEAFLNQPPDGVPRLILYSRWQLPKTVPDDLVLHVAVKDRDGGTVERTMLLDSIPPVSFMLDSEYVNSVRMPLPPGRYRGGSVWVTLERQKAVYELDGIRSPSRRVVKSETLDAVMLPLE